MMLAAVGLGCRPAAAPPSVIVILVDQLREDAAERWLTGVGELAQRGVRITGMRAAAPWTYPSVISLFSGLHPHQHGADGHPVENRLATFDADIPLLHRILRDAGYYTAAFVANPFLRPWNPFHVGFDHFDASFTRDQGNRRLARPYTMPEMYGDRVSRSVRAHFAQRQVGGPEFVYVHLIDVHGPWENAPFPPDYASSVRFVDGLVVDLHRFFHARHGGDLIFVVTSDHGRALGDELRHGEGEPWRRMKLSVHEFNVRIPFLVLPGDPVPAGRVLSRACSNVDVLPTLLDWLGLGPPPDLAGSSLWPAIAAGHGTDERPVYLEVSAFGARSDAVVVGGRKFIRYADPSSERELARRIFSLREDPDEEHAIVDGAAPEWGLLSGLAAAGAGRHAARWDDLDPELEAQLRALGYLQ